MSLKSYVLYSSYQTKALEKFLQQPNATVFTPINCIEERYLDLFDDINMFFDVEKAKSTFSGSISIGEISQTLSHIKCWKEIANNTEIRDNEFALIAEVGIELVRDFYHLATEYQRVYSGYGIIKLQRNRLSNNNDGLYQEGDSIEAILYGDENNYNGEGASLYLIRKDHAKKILAKLESEKPYWLADHFTAFCEPKNMAQAIRYLSQPILIEKEKLDNPLFSIIVPVYNVQRYINQCIESVLSQKYKNYELILIDDGSSDNSLDICFKYAKEHSNIVLVHKINSGVSDTRNYGIKIARGEYVLFLDSDDYWEGDNVLKDLSRLVEDRPDMIINYLTSLYPNKTVKHTLDASGLSEDFQKDYKILFERTIYVGFPVTKVIKRNILEKNNLYFIKGRNFEDIIWSFHLTKYIKTYKVYPSTFYIYRRNREGSISHIVTRKNSEDLFRNLLELIDEMPALKMYFSHNYGVYQQSLESLYSYSVTCYDLLSNEDQKALEETKQLCRSKLDALNQVKDKLSGVHKLNFSSGLLNSSVNIEHISDGFQQNHYNLKK